MSHCHAAPADFQDMIDTFGLAFSHGLLMLAAWRLLSRPDLDSDGASGDAQGGWAKLRKAPSKDQAGA